MAGCMTTCGRTGVQTWGDDVTELERAGRMWVIDALVYLWVPCHSGTFCGSSPHLRWEPFPSLSFTSVDSFTSPSCWVTFYTAPLPPQTGNSHSPLHGLLGCRTCLVLPVWSATIASLDIPATTAATCIPTTTCSFPSTCLPCPWFTEPTYRRAYTTYRWAHRLYAAPYTAPSTAPHSLPA